MKFCTGLVFAALAVTAANATNEKNLRSTEGHTGGITASDNTAELKEDDFLVNLSELFGSRSLDGDNDIVNLLDMIGSGKDQISLEEINEFFELDNGKTSQHTKIDEDDSLLVKGGGKNKHATGVSSSVENDNTVNVKGGKPFSDESDLDKGDLDETLDADAEDSVNVKGGKKNDEDDDTNGDDKVNVKGGKKNDEDDDTNGDDKINVKGGKKNDEDDGTNVDDKVNVKGGAEFELDADNENSVNVKDWAGKGKSGLQVNTEIEDNINVKSDDNAVDSSDSGSHKYDSFMNLLGPQLANVNNKNDKKGFKAVPEVEAEGEENVNVKSAKKDEDEIDDIDSDRDNLDSFTKQFSTNATDKIDIKSGKDKGEGVVEADAEIEGDVKAKAGKGKDLLEADAEIEGDVKAKAGKGKGLLEVEGGAKFGAKVEDGVNNESAKNVDDRLDSLGSGGDDLDSFLKLYSAKPKKDLNVKGGKPSVENVDDGVDDDDDDDDDVFPASKVSGMSKTSGTKGEGAATEDSVIDGKKESSGKPKIDTNLGYEDAMQTEVVNEKKATKISE